MTREQDGDLACLADGGVCGRLARAVDWSKTPLGPVSSWSCTLRGVVRIVLQSRQPMFLSWGPEHIQIYNDAFIGRFTDNHCPWPIGLPGSVAWPDVWPVFGPRVDAALKKAKPCCREDELFPITFGGKRKETYWTYSLTPVFEADGSVGGVLASCLETTARVFCERRGGTFRAFFDRIARVTDPAGITPAAIEVLRERRWDVAFAIAYEVADDGVFRPRATTLANGDPLPDLSAVLRAHMRATRGSHATAPLSVFPISPVRLRGAFCDEPVSNLVVVTVRTTGVAHQDEIVVYGANPWLPLDDAHKAHLERFTEKISLTRGRIEALRAWAAAEGERRDFLLQSPLPTVLLTGPDNVFALANPAFTDMVGRDVTGQRYLEAFPYMADAEVTKTIERVRRTGAPFQLKEQLLPLPRNGAMDDRWFSFTLQPIRNVAEHVDGVMAIAVDITEIVKARQDLEKLNAEREKLLDALEAANRSKDEFLAMLGHELRNPLAPIQTALFVMKRKDPNALVREREIIERQAAHLAHLVDDLLDVARVARGKVTLHTVPLSLGDVIGHAIETASPLFDQKGHVLTVDVPDVGLDVLGDPLRLGQVFANLLTNAAKFTEPGGRIRIEAERDGDVAVVRVSDNGVGISREQLPHVFDTFFQAPRTRDRGHGGLGLGLALVRSLVTLHGGSVTASSGGPGTGSVFEVRLPALPPTARVEAARASETSAATSSKGRRVLLVDDSDDILEIVSTLLRYEGYDVVAAHDGPTALQVAAEFQPDIAVLDIGLPAMDGYELARHLREELGDRAPRLVAMTGYGQAADTERAREAGFDVHLLKPVDPQRLLESLAPPDGKAA